EGRRGPPSAGVHPHGRDSQLIGLLKAVDRVLDIFLPLGLIRREEALMGGVTHQVEPKNKGAPLDLHERLAIGRYKLTLKHFEAVEAYPRGVLDTDIDRPQILALESPKRVGGNADAVGGRARLRRIRPFILSASERGDGAGSGGSDEMATIHGMAVEVPAIMEDPPAEAIG